MEYRQDNMRVDNIRPDNMSTLSMHGDNIDILEEKCARYLHKAREFKSTIRTLKDTIKNLEAELKEQKIINNQITKESQTNKRIDTIESTMKIQYQDLEIQRLKSEVIELKRENKELQNYLKKSNINL